MPDDLDRKLPTVVDRRQLLLAMGVGVVGSATAFTSAPAKAADSEEHWDREADVVCVGSGAAAYTAAIMAADQGASVIVLEKMPVTGGTTSKSAGGVWIPNNHHLRAEGMVDNRDDCLRYMARFSYPRTYDPGSATLGLTPAQFKLLEALYDNGYKALERLETLGAAHFRLFRLYFVDKLAPDNADHLPEDKTPRGRILEYAPPAAKATAGKQGHAFNASLTSSYGTQLIHDMESWLTKHNVPIFTEHRVTRVLKDGKRVVGVEARTGERLVRIRAHRGVIFGTGGYVHNTELVDLHYPGLAGACGRPSSTGDFIAIATEAGALMGSLNSAWLGNVVAEEAIENRAVGQLVFLLPGDSMMLVNKYGNRVVNEKRSYNDRTKVHFVYDPTREEYPNQYLFMVFDARTQDSFAGSFPLPADRREVSYLIEGATLGELADNIQKRLRELGPKISRIALASDFSVVLKKSIARFNGFAQMGKDEDFGRGDADFDKDWHLLTSSPRPGTKFPRNTFPNNTMYPLATAGPFYAIILAAGALDTNGGPMIDEQARLIGWDAKPIRGLYGAGNCIASPTHGAYYGAGGTIGPAIAFGYVAGLNAARDRSA